MLEDGREGRSGDVEPVRGMMMAAGMSAGMAAVFASVVVAGCMGGDAGDGGDARAAGGAGGQGIAGPSGNQATPGATPEAEVVTLAPKVSIESFLAPFGGVYSGGEPADREELEQLAALGVKTIISVDGSEPDIATAHELGMRYVHVPIGYDGLSEEQGLTVARALRDLEGPVFFHCYHGKHRGPAACALAAVMTGRASNEQALAFMAAAGTSQNYQGLWENVRQARVVDDATLDAAPGEFPEVVHPDGLVATMAAAGRTLDHLKLLREAAWGMHPEHPDLVAANEAGRLADDLRRLGETARIRAGEGTADGYDQLMVRSGELAQAMEDLLLAWDSAGAPTVEELGAALTALSRSCDECHRGYRD